MREEMRYNKDVIAKGLDGLLSWKQCMSELELTIREIDSRHVRERLLADLPKPDSNFDQLLDFELLIRGLPVSEVRQYLIDLLCLIQDKWVSSPKKTVLSQDNKKVRTFG